MNQFICGFPKRGIQKLKPNSCFLGYEKKKNWLYAPLEQIFPLTLLDGDINMNERFRSKMTDDEFLHNITKQSNRSHYDSKSSVKIFTEVSVFLNWM